MASVKAKSSGGRPRDDSIRQYFIFNIEDGYSYCQVEECKMRIKSNHNGNLEKHLKTRHTEQYNAINKKKEETDFSKRSRSKSVSLPVSISAEDIRNACVELVTVNGRPFSMIDDTGFRKILELLLEACDLQEACTMSSANVRELVIVKAKDVRESIREELKGRLISLKVDAATRHDRGFLGINIQFLDDGKVHVRTLAIVELIEQHTAEYLQRVIERVLNEYDISVSNIYSFTSDNGANMVKLGKLLKITQSNSTTEAEEEEDTSGSEDGSETEAEDNDEESAKGLDKSNFCHLSDKNSSLLISNIRCAAHTLQLAIYDALKSVRATKGIIAKARRVVKELRKPTIRRMLLVSYPNAKNAKLDVATRWNSTADMFESLLKLKDFCVEFSETYPHTKDLHLTDMEWQFIEDYLKSLMPARVTTLRLQDEQLTLGSFYGIWMECKLITAEISTTLAQELVKAMEKREPQLVENDALLASVFLDPRYLSILPLEHHAAALDKLEKVWQKLEELDAQSQPLQLNIPVNVRKNVPIHANQCYSGLNADVFRKMCDRANSTRVIKSQGTVNIRRLLQEFHDTAVIDVSDDLLQFWESKKRSMPQLYRIATIVHAAPATQVTVERLFSGVAYILSSLRTNLKSNVLDDIMIVRCNHQNSKRNPTTGKSTASRRQRRRIESDSSPAGSSGSSTSTPIEEQSYVTLIETFQNYEQASPNNVVYNQLSFNDL